MKTKQAFIFLLVMLLSCLSLPLPEAYATTETRYFQYNTWYRNGLWAYALNTTALSTLSRSIIINIYDGNVVVDQYLGIKVWKRASNGTETEITSGSSVGIAVGNITGEFSAQWSCPQTTLATTDLILVKVYADDFSPPTAFKANFTTEQLGVTVLNSASWNISYHITKVYNSRTRITTYTWYWGSTAYDSRIANFKYGEAGGPITINLYGTINPKFTINHLNQWTFNRQTAITQTFTIGKSRALTFPLEATINPIFTIDTSLTKARLINLLGTISQIISASMQKTIQFNPSGIINQTFTVEAFKQFFGNIINLSGNITQTISVQGVATILGEGSQSWPLFVLLGGLILIPIVLFFIHRRRT